MKAQKKSSIQIGDLVRIWAYGYKGPKARVLEIDDRYSGSVDLAILEGRKKGCRLWFNSCDVDMVQGA